jgi:hypothetical protein
MSRNLGALTLLDPSGPAWLVMGVLSLYLLYSVIYYCIYIMIYMISYDMIYIYIFNCNWVDTRWQQYSTHLHTNNTQNAENGTYITIKKLGTYITIKKLGTYITIKKFKTNLGIYIYNISICACQVSEMFVTVTVTVILLTSITFPIIYNTNPRLLDIT